MSDFYLTLPSNSSLNTFPDNTLTSYRVKLERSLDLSDYHVGLVEIQYPVSWHNVSNACLYVKQPGLNSNKKICLRDGKYDDARELLGEIRRHLSSNQLEETITMFVDQTTKLSYVDVKMDGVFIEFSDLLSNIFGFEKKSYGFGLHQSIRQSDINEGQCAFYVYTNIIEHQLVGDTMAPLLRVVPIRGDKSDTNRSEEFRHVFYFPTINSRSDQIEILIRRDNGEPVSFQTGKVVITLHFKKAA